MADDAPSNTLQPIADPITITSTDAATAQSIPSALPNDILRGVSGASFAAAATGTLTPNAAGAGTGTATPLSGISDMPLTDEQRSLSLKVSLADLVARASGHWAQKRFEEAAEVYAQAAEMQAEMNGEMAVENAEILFLYGRSLFKVGQENSDVLGGKAPTTEEQQAAGKSSRKAGGKKAGKKSAAATAEGSAAAAAAAADVEGKTTEEVAAAVVKEAAKIAGEGAEAAKAAVNKELEGKKPLFQFTGDENWDDSDEEGQGEEEEEGEGEGGEGDEDDEELDDLGSAFEILDLARVFFNKQLEVKLAALSGEGKGKEVENNEGENSDAGIRHIKERLTEIYDRLAEISLENERFPRAIADMREALRLTQDLVPDDNERNAEAHFKLSLALEFGSITSQHNDDGSEGPKEVNQEMRDEAARELEAAVNSTKAHLQSKEVELATLHSPEDNEITRNQIADVKEVVADLEQRLVDLRGPLVDMKSALGGLAPASGLLGAAAAESADQTEARIEEAKKTATDLSGLVRKKPKATSAPSGEDSGAANGGNKRKAMEDLSIEDDASKKARTEEATS